MGCTIRLDTRVPHQDEAPWDSNYRRSAEIAIGLVVWVVRKLFFCQLSRKETVDVMCFRRFNFRHMITRRTNTHWGELLSCWGGDIGVNDTETASSAWGRVALGRRAWDM